jgi:acetyltransferase-like isoleucine patch superfamily enzyme
MNIARALLSLVARGFGNRTVLASLRVGEKADAITVYRSIRGKGNRIEAKESVFGNVSVDIVGTHNIVKISDTASLNGVEIYIRGNNNHIEIGERCRVVKEASLWMEDDNCMIRVGSYTSFISAHLAATETGSSIEIGYDCMFAYDIDVRTGDSHSVIDRKTGKRINPASNVFISDHVWIAAHVRILKGVRIMKNSIVATGSIVVKGSEEENVIYAGVPARVVKRDIDWCRERI